MNQNELAKIPPTVQEVLRSPGKPLDPNTHTFMETRLGYDFSRVRVHTDRLAAESAQAVNAKAYTVGRKIVFGSGQYAPETTDGRQLLAHELTHVVQQRDSHFSLIEPYNLEIDSSVLMEKQAQQVANRIMGGAQANGVFLGAFKPLIQREVVVEKGYVEPRSVYLIKESIHYKMGLPGKLPSLMQVMRSVTQLHAVWEPKGGEPSLWEAIKDYLGIKKIKRVYTGEHRWVLVYQGWRNFIEIFGKRKETPAPGIKYGDDPIPHIQLYGKPQVKFVSPGGGKPSTAIEIYDGSTNKLFHPSEAEVPNPEKLPGFKLAPGPRIEKEKTIL